jgi:hypothetical protein
LHRTFGPASAFFSLLLPLDSTVFELFVQTLHLGEVGILKFIKSLNFIRACLFGTSLGHVYSWHYSFHLLGSWLFLRLQKCLLGSSVTFPIAVCLLTAAIGLLEDSLIAEDFPLEVLLDIGHSSLVVHLGDDRRTWGGILPVFNRVRKGTLPIKVLFLLRDGWPFGVIAATTIPFEDVCSHTRISL